MKRHFQGLKGFVNGVLRTISREKDHLEFSDEAVRFSVPAWLLELWKESYDETTRQKMFTYFLEDHPLTVRCNIHLASKEEAFCQPERSAGECRGMPLWRFHAIFVWL